MGRFYKLILLTLLVLSVLKLFLPEMKNNKELISAFWSNKTHSASEFNVIACGDSRVYRGISGDVVAPLNKQFKFINLGYSSAGLSEDYFDFVVSKFDSNSKNNFLLVGITPHSLTKEAFKNEELTSYQQTSKFAIFRHKKLSPILKYFAPYKPKELANTSPPNYLQTFEKNGWVASDKISPDSTLAIKSYQKTFSNYQADNELAHSMIDKLTQIANTGIIVIAFRPPTTSKMSQLEDSISGINMERIKRQLEKNGIKWLDFNNSDFVSYDGSHLNETSARKLSLAIGHQIKETYFSQKQ